MFQRTLHLKSCNKNTGMILKSPITMEKSIVTKQLLPLRQEDLAQLQKQKNQQGSIYHLRNNWKEEI